MSQKPDWIQNIKFMVFPVVLVIVLIIYTFYYFKTSAMLPVFDEYIESTLLPGSKRLRFSQKAGLTAGLTTYYSIPKGLSNKEIYTHYCRLMGNDGDWIETEAIREDPYLLGSACNDPWKNKKKNHFSFEFCNKSGSTFVIIWGRDKNSLYPDDKDLLINMGWRSDGPVDSRCEEWSET